MANRSAAVCQQRHTPTKDLDYFPTPPWATRALFEYVLPEARDKHIYEPACGEGWMAETINEYARVHATDIFDYGYGFKADFLSSGMGSKQYDWVITNPPFNKAEEFIQQSRKVATKGCAMLVRTAFVETTGRYNRLFKDNPPTIFAPFAERVPMIYKKMDHKASSAMSTCWMVWKWDYCGDTIVKWIQPCKKELIKPEDIEREAQWNNWKE